MFRSPPPHRRSSGHKGGRSELEKLQTALQRTVARLGYDKIPLNDDSLRPFLEVLWRHGTAHGLMVYMGDIPKKFPGRFFCCLTTDDVFKMKAVSDAIGAELKARFSTEEIRRAVPVIKIGSPAVCYFEGIWTPADALDGRMH